MEALDIIIVNCWTQGRRAVKRGSLTSCQQAQERIRVNTIPLLSLGICYRFSVLHFINIFCVVLQANSVQISQQPLRVEILHSVVMAHQTFALHLGSWLQKIISYSGNLHHTNLLALLFKCVFLVRICTPDAWFMPRWEIYAVTYIHLPRTCNSYDCPVQHSQFLQCISSYFCAAFFEFISERIAIISSV